MVQNITKHGIEYHSYLLTPNVEIIYIDFIEKKDSLIFRLMRN
nr:MAG TPA: hypothetical protein [Crassvirales sp.]